MPKNPNILLVVIAAASILVGACAGTAGSSPAAAKVEPIPVAYTGVIESMDGNQWVVNGQAIVVDPAVVRDGPFKIGDTVKIEVAVDQDGSLIVTRVELPEQSDLTDLPVFGGDNINDDNINDDNVNDDNSNDENVNDDNSNDDNVNDSNANDDNATDGNANDDNATDDDANGGNSNDDNGGDDNSSGGGGGGGDSGSGGGGGGDSGGGGGGGGDSGGGGGGGDD